MKADETNPMRQDLDVVEQRDGGFGGIERALMSDYRMSLNG